MRRRFGSLQELKDSLGQPLGPSGWLVISQTRIHQFAEVTGDHQWIHTQPERARRDSPYGSTVAHGFLTLSLASMFLMEVFSVDGARNIINYGLNRVRFPAPVPEGAKIRMRAVPVELEEAKSGVRVVFDLTFECDGQDRPVCVAQAVYLLQMQ